jgi:protein-disulfide isomerase
MQRNDKPWYRRWWAIVLLAFLILLLSFIFALLFRINAVAEKNGTTKIEDRAKTGRMFEEANHRLAIGDGDNFWLGSAKPDITIVEFADFSCPYCRKSYAKIRELGIRHKDKVKIIFRDFPVREDFSMNLAMAGRCAGEQGLFWPMHDRLYQGTSITGNDQLYALAGQAGTDMKRFDDCFKKEKYMDAIKKDYLAGEKLGVTGTPTWFVNGRKIEGDVPLAVWEEITK